MIDKFIHPSFAKIESILIMYKWSRQKDVMKRQFGTLLYASRIRFDGKGKTNHSAPSRILQSHAEYSYLSK